LAAGSVAGRCRVVAKAERMASAQFLANALEEALAETDCELLTMRYGMKLPAEDVFPLLLECRGLMAVKHGALFSRKCWNNTVLDFGAQNVLSMQPILVRPKSNLHEVPWVNYKTVQSYSSFGKLGGGYGGAQFLGTADGPAKKSQATLVSGCTKSKQQGHHQLGHLPNVPTSASPNNGQSF